MSKNVRSPAAVASPPAIARLTWAPAIGVEDRALRLAEQGALGLVGTDRDRIGLLDLDERAACIRGARL